jgi:hypothetical protein
MHKIIQFALSAKFGKDIENLMDIIAATHNPEVAAEVLLGIYTEPEIPNRIEIMHVEKTNRTDVQFTMYDKYTNLVYYKYRDIETHSAWFRKGHDIIEANIANKRRWSEDAARELGITEAELKENFDYASYKHQINDVIRTGECDLQDWCKLVEKATVILHPED